MSMGNPADLEQPMKHRSSYTVLDDDGAPGSPWFLSRDNRVCFQLWVMITCCCGSIGGIVAAVLEEEAIYIGALHSTAVG